MIYSFVCASNFIGRDVDKKKKKIIQLMMQSSHNELFP